MRRFFTVLALFAMITTTFAQRVTDNLDRGLVAVDPRSGGGLFLSWRIQADEYYDVTYNLYRNGVKLNSSPLTVSNYHDASGNSSYTYTVKAVVNGVEQAASKSAKMFTTNKYTKNGHAGQPGHLRIAMKDVVDRNGKVIYSADGSTCTWDYSLNDVSLADLDGDGEVEIIVKRINETDGSTSYPDGTSKQLYETSNTTAYTIIEAYKLNGTRLWWIDCGPNMVSMSAVEINCVAYDWDEDGKAEIVMRGADNMIIHKADGSTYNVGNMSVNTRNDLVSHTSAQYAWTRTGSEYLLYLNGATASPYQVMEYPLKRFESDESGKTEQQVWSPNNSNGGYGHRSSKYFFGAPVLDGRHASIFLARGIYTQTKMVALDVNRSSHQLTQRWYWKDNTVGSSWFGQGNHNFSIADVDGDGCDEIIYGSMTIDNNGKGLSTSGLGHGDAMHVGDLDPFRKGLEVFACNEEKPSNNLRDASTSEILYRLQGSSDDGRALMGNFLADYPGCSGRSVSSGVISAASHSVISEYTADNFISWSQLNGRIYWDGDLLEEMMASTSGSQNQPGVVYKAGNTRIMQTDGAATINSTKKNHCAQGDIIGDWREEIIMRSSDNKALLVYSTDIATEYRIPSLWYDHAYRQAMVWQPCGYNQPPHTSFFLGELEGITKAPVPYTNTNRSELSANSTITSNYNSKAVMLCNAGNYGIDANGVSPSLLVVNVPSTVSGTGNNNNITRSYSVTSLGASINGTNQKGDLKGTMNFVKQGDGLLKLTARTFSYTGNTDVWAGSLQFCGTLNSPLWMNRHTTLYTAGTYNKSVTMEYGSTLYLSYTNCQNDGSAPATEYTTANINTLNLYEGSRVVFDIDDSGNQTDVLNITTLNVRKRDWSYGPQYLAPVLQINSTRTLGGGSYKIGNLTNATGLNDIIIEGSFASGAQLSLKHTNGALYLEVAGVPANSSNSAATPCTNLDGQMFVMTADGKTLCPVKDSNAPQDCKVIDFTSFNSNTDYANVRFAKVTNSSAQGDNLYTIQFCNASGANYSLWGTAGYLNFQPNGATIVFALGLNNQYGQDCQNGGLWAISYANDQGYLVKNVANGTYYNPCVAAPSAEPVYVQFKTLDEALNPNTNNDNAAEEDNATAEDNTPSDDNNSSDDNASSNDNNSSNDNTSSNEVSGPTETPCTDLNGKMYIITANGSTLCPIKNSNAPQDCKVVQLDEFNASTYYAYAKFAKVTNSSAQGDNLYTIQFCNTSGSNYSLWGTSGYLNFQPNGGSIVFALGLNNQYGQDCQNGGLWAITRVEGQGYLVKNVANGTYYNPSVASPSAEPVYVQFITMETVVSTPYVQDFEQSSSNRYGFTTNGASISQYTMSDGSHCLHADQAGGSGDRSANLDLTAQSSAFATATDYTFEFDWGLSVANQKTSTTTLLADNGSTLFTITTPAYGTSTLTNASGTTIATLTNDGYTKAAPKKLSHFKVASNGDGTYLTVTYNGQTVVNNYKISDGLVHLTALNTWLGRAVSHLAIDNIVLTTTTTSIISHAKNRTYIEVEEEEATDITTVDAEPEIVAIYSLSGSPQSSLQRGVNIVKMSNNTIRKIYVK